MTARTTFYRLLGAMGVALALAGTGILAQGNEPVAARTFFAEMIMPSGISTRLISFNSSVGSEPQVDPEGGTHLVWEIKVGVVRHVDLLSPEFFTFVMSRAPIREVTINVNEMDISGKLRTAASYKLSNVVITSVKGDGVMEQLALDFGRVEMRVGTEFSCWDVEHHTPC